MYVVLLGQAPDAGVPVAVILAIITGAIISLVALVVSIRVARRIRDIGGPAPDERSATEPGPEAAE